MVIKHIENARERQKNYYDKGRKDVQFKVGDMVWRVNHVLSDSANYFSKKLAPPLIGSYQIIEVISPVTYRLDSEIDNDRKKPIVHVSQIEEYIAPRPLYPRPEKKNLPK